MDTLAVGVDIGGTKIACALINQDGHIIKQIKSLTNVIGGYPAILLQIIESVRELTYDLHNPITGIGVGVTGQIDATTGVVVSSDNLKWVNVPLQSDLEEVFSTVVTITNDVRAAMWGEWRYGAGKGLNHLVCIFVGTGIGGGIVSSGKMLDGFGNTAGEIGHLIVTMNGPVCSCGNYGCLEALASGWAIAKNVREIIKKDPDRGRLLLKLADNQLNVITAHQVIEAFRANDPLAIEVMENVSKALIAGLTGVVNILNPQRIILGGGILEGCPELLDVVLDGVKKMSLKVATEKVEIVKPQLLGNAGVIGAASLVMDEFPQKGC